MNFIDIIVIIFILIGGIVGFKRGFFNQTISFVGFLLVLILSFLLKNEIATFLCLNFPFFSFGGLFTGVTILNILLYEVIAFIILVIVLSIILKVIIFVTKIFEKILKFTIILGIPSKILGALVGLIEYYIIAFIALFCLNQPTFESIKLNESKVSMFILHKTPILNRVIENTLDAVDEIYSLTETYDDKDNNTGLNEKTLDILFKYKLVDVETLEKLIEEDKLDLSVSVLDKYKEE